MSMTHEWNRVIFLAGVAASMLLLLNFAGRAGAQGVPQAASGARATTAAVTLTPKQHEVAMRALCGGLVSAGAAAPAGQSRDETRKVAFEMAERAIKDNLHVSSAGAHAILESLLRERQSAVAAGTAQKSLSRWACSGVNPAGQSAQ